MYSQHCLSATNSLPWELLSTLPCFLENQCINEEFSHTKKPVLDLLDTLSPVFSASTFPLMVNPNPCCAGIFSGKTSSPSTCPYLLHVQCQIAWCRVCMYCSRLWTQLPLQFCSSYQELDCSDDCFPEVCSHSSPKKTVVLQTMSLLSIVMSSLSSVWPFCMQRQRK